MLLLIEFYLDGLLVYKAHLVIVSVYAVLYIAMNVYVTLNVRLVYKIMTWKDTISFVWATLAIAIIIISFFLFNYCGLQKYKTKDASKNN